MNSETEIIRANLDDSHHQEYLFEMLDGYMRNPFGAERPFDANLRQQLILGLKRHTGTVVLLAILNARPVGILNAFAGFSTFAAKPILNIHDVLVHPDHNGQGIGTRLMEAVQAVASDIGACKMTLEVRADNSTAKRVYEKFGFRNGDSDETAMEFWAKEL